MKVTGNIHIAKGTRDSITTESHYVGPVDFVPIPNGRAYIMRPASVLHEKNEESRKRGVMETPPLSRMDLSNRLLLELTKAEVIRVFIAPVGVPVTITRKGWGEIFESVISKGGEIEDLSREDGE